MKTVLDALVFAAFLSGSAFAADPATTGAARGQSDKQRVDDSHTAGAPKKTGAKKARTNQTYPAREPLPSGGEISPTPSGEPSPTPGSKTK